MEYIEIIDYFTRKGEFSHRLINGVEGTELPPLEILATMTIYYIRDLTEK